MLVRVYRPTQGCGRRAKKREKGWWGCFLVCSCFVCCVFLCFVLCEKRGVHGSGVCVVFFYIHILCFVNCVDRGMGVGCGTCVVKRGVTPTHTHMRLTASKCGGGWWVGCCLGCGWGGGMIKLILRPRDILWPRDNIAKIVASLQHCVQNYERRKYAIREASDR